MCERGKRALRVNFDGELKLEFHGMTICSDGGLLAYRELDDAIEASCECLKFQSHVIEDEMIPNDVVPGNTTETIWKIMKRCAFTERESHTPFLN